MRKCIRFMWCVLKQKKAKKKEQKEGKEGKDGKKEKYCIYIKNNKDEIYVLYDLLCMCMYYV